MEIRVGDGGTICHWSDMVPVTVIEVIRFKTGARKGQLREVLVQEDNSIRTDKNGISEIQRYEYSRNPIGRISVFAPNQHGVLKPRPGYSGISLRIGTRRRYWNPSF